MLFPIIETHIAGGTEIISDRFSVYVDNHSGPHYLDSAILAISIIPPYSHIHENKTYNFVDLVRFSGSAINLVKIIENFVVNFLKI